MAVTGLRGSVSFAADGTLARRPENWREMITLLYPNGQAPLTALLSLMKSKSTDDPIFHWFEKDFPNPNVTITGVYSDALSSAWGAASKTQGDSVWLKMSADHVTHFKLGHVVAVSAPASGDLAKNRFNVLITSAPTSNGASSFVTGKLVSATFTSLASSSYTSARPAGTAHPEGDTSGTSIGYDPVEVSNYTQIFRNSLEHTRTAKRTRLRTGDAVEQAKKECLELHSVEMEMALFNNGPKYVTTGANGQPLRLTAGIRGAITTNRWDFRVATGVGSTTWAGSAADAAKNYNWLLDRLEELFRVGTDTKIGFCGNGVPLAINKLIMALGSTNVNISLGETKMSYGFKFQNLTCPFGELLIKTHPLWNQDAAFRSECTILDTEQLTYRYVDDTTYKPDIQANDLDGQKSEYLTECGLQMGTEKTHAILNGLGSAPAS